MQKLSETSQFLLKALQLTASGATFDVGGEMVDQRHSALLINRGLGASKSFDSPELNTYKKISKILWEKQSEEIFNIVKNLRNIDIKCAITKGADLAKRLYPDMPLCFRGDIDVLINDKDYQSVKTVMNSLGYSQGLLDVPNAKIIPFNLEKSNENIKASYSRPSFAKIFSLDGISPTDSSSVIGADNWRKPVFISKNQVLAVVTFDFSTGVDASRTTASVVIETDDAPFCGGYALTPTFTLCYCIALLYLEIVWDGSSIKLSRFAELSQLIIGSHNSIDWKEFNELVVLWGIQPSAYYVLVFISKLINYDLPKEIYEFRPKLGRRSRDFGWQLFRLLGESEDFPECFEQALAGR